ncbi:15750_t:CDS:2 [Funneliformis geosporum]|nr:15750_t:CDS:2 [Funneliformis geosporum]
MDESIPIIYFQSTDTLNDKILEIKNLIENEGISLLQEEYSGLSKEVVYPHTDGTLLSGIISTLQGSIKTSSPKMILFQDVESDMEGGELILVDSKKVLNSILIERPGLAEILMKPGCISFCQAEQSSLNFPVYERRPDDSNKISSSQLPYHMNPDFQIKIALKKNQILILDNYRVLHGSNEFDDNPMMFRNLVDKLKDQSIYHATIDSNSKGSHISTGIILDQNIIEVEKKYLELKYEFNFIYNLVFKDNTPVAILYQALQPPLIEGIRKTMKPRGYSDSGADIAFSLKYNGIPIVIPVDNPYPSRDIDWVFPDTEEGISIAIAKGAKTIWANTVLFDEHPLNLINDDVKVIGQHPKAAQRYDNKWVTNELIRSHAFPVPYSILIGHTSHNGVYGLNDLTLEVSHKVKITFPAIIKPIRGRGSQGVKKVNSMKQLRTHAEMILSTGTVIDEQFHSEFGNLLILEQYLEGEEITVVIMPPGTYNINYKSTKFDNHWHLPPVKRFDHQDGIAPYSGVVAVMKNSELLSNAELQDPLYQKVTQECERAGQIIKSLAPIRIDCLRISQGGQFFLFDLNMKPNMTGPERPGRNDQDSLVSMSARGIG